MKQIASLLYKPILFYNNRIRKPSSANNAEHAIKSFAALREVIEGTTTANGIQEYLVLLSIAETCKYKGIDFLQFLLSGESDIDALLPRDISSRRGPK